MIVVAIIAINAAIAIPKLMSARVSANEGSAISTMRTLASGEAQIQTAGAIDTDGDGAGEFGYFGELSGADPLRVSVAGAPAMGTAGVDELQPAIVTFPLGNIASSAVARQGYHYKLFLPAATVAGASLGIAEAPTGGADPANLPDPNNGETLWCCYGWPTDYGKTGRRAFFINQDGELLQCGNRGAAPYTGTTKVPGFGEAYTANDMGSFTRIGVVGGADNTLWTLIQN